MGQSEMDVSLSSTGQGRARPLQALNA